MDDKEKDFTKILDDIIKNKELLEVFNDQTFIWWSKKEIIKVVKFMVNKYIKKNSSPI